MPRFTDFEILDSGDPEGLRYVVEAIEQHPDDTTRAATVHIASCYSKDTAARILGAFEAYAELLPLAQALEAGDGITITPDSATAARIIAAARKAGGEQSPEGLKVGARVRCAARIETGTVIAIWEDGAASVRWTAEEEPELCSPNDLKAL